MPSPPNLPWLYCLSAPTSPNRASEFYRDFDDDIPIIDQTDEFAFHVSKDATQSTASAAELFHGGKIRPLEPLANDPCHADIETTASVRSPLLPSSTSPRPSHSKEDHVESKGRKTFWSAFTPKRNKPTNPRVLRSLLDEDDDDDGDDGANHRGRQRAHSSSMSASIRRGTRSLSPIRLPIYPPWVDDEEQDPDHHQDQKKKKESNSLSSTLLTLVQKSSKSSRMRKLKNFLLFRSASEGRASDRLEPLKRFEADETGTKNVGRMSVSAHERHYAMKKAASEDLKKKTFLPYKRGILGR